MRYDDTWNLVPPLGFQGLREDLPLKIYIRQLPHWRQQGATYFVTFRLADSIPGDKIEYLNRLRADWFARNPPPQSRQAVDQLGRMLSKRIEYWLDKEMGSCVLQEERFVKIVDESLKHFHGVRYELGASVIMSNHVHCIIRPCQTSTMDLEDILGRVKWYTAMRINALLNKSGALWQAESYDRIIRDPEHLWRCLQYIAKNPSRAGRAWETCRLWVNPEWEKLGWRFVS